MKVVNFDEVKAGDLVQVPRYQFAPMRRGWNGWLFSEAIVLRKGIGRKSNRVGRYGVEKHERLRNGRKNISRRLRVSYKWSRDRAKVFERGRNRKQGRI